MQIINYLFYKLYRANLVGSLKGIAPFAAVCHLAGLLSVNLLILYAFLRKIDFAPQLMSSGKQVGFFALFMIVSFAFIFFYKDRYKSVISLYINEPESLRRRGNVKTWIYVTISFGAIFLVAFFKPGKF